MIVRVALDLPVRKLFDYRCDGTEPPVGARVLAPLGNDERLGLVLDRADQSSLPDRSLRSVGAVLTDLPPLGEELVAFLRKAEIHTQLPIGKLAFAALPPQARRRITGRKAAAEASGSDKRPAQPEAGGGASPIPGPTQKAIGEISEQLDGGHAIHLVSGMPNTGKIKVITEAIATCAEGGRTALVLAPSIHEINKLAERLERRLPGFPIGRYHSDLSEAERMAAWREAIAGTTRVLIGTRSAVFAPMADLGLICVLNENDPLHRAERGLIYSARDLAAVRGRCAGCLVLMSSAIPSVELRHAAQAGKLRLSALPRPASARSPQVEIIDISARRLFGGISVEMENALRRSLSQRGPAAVLINRRGRGGLLYCTSCRHILACPNRNCRNPKLALDSEGRCVCRQCGYSRKMPETCPACGSGEFDSCRAGSTRIAESLANRFPEARILRADAEKDPAQLRGELGSGSHDIIVGTNLLVNLQLEPGTVAVIDADSALHGPSYRSAELLLDTIAKLSRLADDVNLVIQTRFVGHHLFESLRRGSYETFAHSELAERREAGLPPFRRLALLSASAAEASEVAAFVGGAKLLAGELRQRGVHILEPVTSGDGANGRTHMQLLVSAPDRPKLQDMLRRWLPMIESSKPGKGISWSVEVDPERW